MRKALATLVAACLALSSRNSPPAENCPTHALITIVPFPTDGPTDALARDLGWRMRPIPGQPVIIENVASAAWSIGMTRGFRVLAWRAPE